MAGPSPIGATLIAKFHWILYLFGIFLILTAIKMLVLRTEHKDPDKNVVVRRVRPSCPTPWWIVPRPARCC